MGWVQRVFRSSRRKERHLPYTGQHAQSTGRSWVNPQFLGLAIGVGLLAVGGYVWVQSGEAPGGLGDTGPQQRAPATTGPLLHTFIGYESLAALQSASDFGGCNLDCRVLKAWYDWLDAHPGAVIVEKDPVYESGILLGYRIDYRDS